MAGQCVEKSTNPQGFGMNFPAFQVLGMCVGGKKTSAQR